MPPGSKRLIEQATFDDKTEQQNLSDDDTRTMWAWDSYRSYYPHFCEVAQKFRCDKTYAAHTFISTINGDWHPLGFARLQKVNTCQTPKAMCKDKDWTEISRDIRPDFGSRIFLMDNLEIKSLGSRYLIDFDKPEWQHIPDIGPLHAP